MKIEVSCDLLEEITAAELKITLKSLQRDYRDRKAGKQMYIFSADKAADLFELKQHIDAFKLVGRYYGAKL
jgi:hypothetical protein